MIHLAFPPRRYRPWLPAVAVAVVPLRLFIGLGWLRAFAEKAPDPAWRDGSAITTFLADHLARGQIALPVYEPLVVHLFLPQAVALGWLVMLGQLLVGLAVVVGLFTRPALVGGLVMSLNFILAGAPNPSAFYAVIQATLLAANAGTLLGLDGWLTHRHGGLRCHTRSPVVSARRRHGRPWLAVAALLALASGYALLHAHDLSPAGSVHDPAVLLAVLASLAALRALLADLAGTPLTEPNGPTGHDTDSSTCTDVPALTAAYTDHRSSGRRPTTNGSVLHPEELRITDAVPVGIDHRLEKD